MTLTDVIDAYVLLQQSLGKRFKSARTLLRRFSREADEGATTFSCRPIARLVG